LDAQIAGGEFGGLMGWLRQHVHGQGARVGAQELLKLSTGKPLSAAATLRYLEAKYLGDESVVGSAAGLNPVARRFMSDWRGWLLVGSAGVFNTRRDSRAGDAAAPLVSRVRRLPHLLVRP